MILGGIMTAMWMWLMQPPEGFPRPPLAFQVAPIMSLVIPAFASILLGLLRKQILEAEKKRQPPVDRQLEHSSAINSSTSSVSSVAHHATNITIHVPPPIRLRKHDCPGCGARSQNSASKCAYCGGTLPFEDPVN
jgi:hypothetical protein